MCEQLFNLSVELEKCIEKLLGSCGHMSWVPCIQRVPTSSSFKPVLQGKGNIEAMRKFPFGERDKRRCSNYDSQSLNGGARGAYNSMSNWSQALETTSKHMVKVSNEYIERIILHMLVILTTKKIHLYPLSFLESLRNSNRCYAQSMKHHKEEVKR